MDIDFYTIHSDGAHRRWGVWLLGGLMLVCFLVQWCLPRRLFDALLLSRNGLLPYSLITHALMHGDGVHLAWNLLLLATFGTVVCRRLGSVLFVVLCLWAAGVVGIVHLRFDGDPTLGCSGMTYFLMGLAPFCDPHADVGIAERQFLIPIWILALLLVSKNILLAPFIRLNVSYVGHFSGALFGVLVGLVLLPGRSART